MIDLEDARPATSGSPNSLFVLPFTQYSNLWPMSPRLPDSLACDSPSTPRQTLEVEASASSEPLTYIEELRAQAAYWKARCILAERQLSELKRELEMQSEPEACTRPRKKARPPPDTFILTSKVYIDYLLEEEAEKAEREKRKQEKRAAKKAKEQQAATSSQRANRDPSAAFTGSLGAKNKNSLQVIASALSLVETGTNNELVARIKAHFESHPLLKTDPRFMGLFNRSRSRPQQQVDQENIPPLQLAQVLPH